MAVTDSSGRTGTAAVDLQVVAGNTAPTAEILNRNLQINTNAGPTDPASQQYGADGTNDGNAGGDTDAEGNPTGRITLRAVGFDPDQPAGTLIYSWSQVSLASGFRPIDPDDHAAAGGTVLELEGALTDTVSFAVPELGNTDGDSEDFIILLAVLDQHGVTGTAFVNINVDQANSIPVADAGPDQIVEPGDFVRLNGAASSDADLGQAIAATGYTWVIQNISTTPGPTEVLASVRNQALADLNAWYEAWTGVDQAGDADLSAAALVDVLSGPTGAYPYFDAPNVADGLSNVQITFRLSVVDSADPNLTDSDDVTITITNRFYSGNVSSPSFCTGLSLGGPATYAFDSDGDGVADICSLRTTRRGTVAIQNALDSLVRLGSTLSRTDAGADGDPATLTDNRTSDVGFAALVAGQAGVDAVPAAPGATPPVVGVDAQAAVAGTCNTVPGLTQLGDSAADLAADACATGRVSGPASPG